MKFIEIFGAVSGVLAWITAIAYLGSSGMVDDKHGRVAVALFMLALLLSLVVYLGTQY
jgi:hypothetical protein